MKLALRRQPPAYSPLALETVWAGAHGAIHEPASLRAAMVSTLCEMYSARSALLVGSGTMALQLALAGVRATVSRRPVALPAYSCFDVAAAAEGADVSAILYDVDPTTLGPDDSSLQRALEGEPAAIVGAHLYGYPVDMDRLARLARAANAVLIEDAAQGAGGRLGGAPLGSFGSVSVLSFGRGKGWTAGGGGALLAHDDVGEAVIAWAASQIASPSRGVREVAVLAAQWTLGRPSAYGIPAAIPFLRLGETVYHPPRPPTAMAGSALRALAAGLTKLDQEVTCRRAVAQRTLARARSSHRVRTVQPVDGAAPGYLRLPFLTTGNLATHVRRLQPHGVAFAYPSPLAALEPFRARVLNRDVEFTGAQALAATLLTFPTHSLLEATDVAALEQWLSP